MPEFREELLHFVWQQKLFKPVPLITKQGSMLTVLKPGQPNTDAGPDFSNASIRLNDLVLVGNVEIHLKTSDWLKHKHQFDNSYNTLILHVVYEHDQELEQNINHQVEVLELKNFIREGVIEKHSKLLNSGFKIHCSKLLHTVPEIYFTAWLERVSIERLEMKTKRTEHYFSSFNNDYLQTFYLLLLRSFGFNVNAVPFELLAKQLPLNILLRHSDNLFQLEALLLGTSGLLENHFENAYVQKVQNEYEFLKSKYLIIPLEQNLFKFSRLRPANFPNVRLLQLANLIYRNAALFTNLQPIAFDKLKQLLVTTPGEQWKNRFKLDGKTTLTELKLGDASAESLIINAFVPFFFFYALKSGKEHYKDYALSLLKQCTFEVNAKTRLFAMKNSDLKDASASQGLIQLFDNYCQKKQCLQCGIGASILRT